MQVIQTWIQRCKQSNQETNKRANEPAGDGCPITKAHATNLTPRIQSHPSHQKNAFIRTKGRPGVLRTASNSQQTKDYFLGQTSNHRVPSWLENETNQKNTFQLECSVFRFWYHTVFCRKNSNNSNILKIRARSRCSPQRGAGSCNTSCTGSAKYLTQALAKEPRCTLTLRSQNKHPA